jgi:hypothetical protein
MIEEFLGKRLNQMLGKQILIAKGPQTITKYTGIRPEVFVHFSRLEDFDGIMPDGAHTTRRPAFGPSTYKGFEEERPGRITLIITCLASTYKLVQDICNLLTPGVLLSLELLPKIPLGSLPDDSVKLYFEDYTANLHKAEHSRINIEDTTYLNCELTFHLNGFIHVWLTKRGGFTSKSTSMPKRKEKSGK